MLRSLFVVLSLEIRTWPGLGMSNFRVSHPEITLFLGALWKTCNNLCVYLLSGHRLVSCGSRTRRSCVVISVKIPG